MNYLDDIDLGHPDLGDLYDELPLWSAPFGALLLDRVPVRRGMTVLDVGAATGFLSMELALRCGSNSQIIAVDPWKSAVTRLRRQLAHRGIDNVRVIEQDAATIELPESSVDLIVSNLGMNNFENPAAVLGICFRAAKPGAKLFLTTNVVGHMREFYDVFRQTLVELGQDDRLPDLDAHVRHRGTIDSINEMLNRAGFESVGVTTGSFRMRFADGSALLRHYFIRLGFVPGWKSIVPDALVERTFAVLERNLNSVAARCGELAVSVPMVCVEAGKPQ